jgi:uncharacterized membrane protein YkvI
MTLRAAEIALLIIGTVIGAGFATGAEIIVFFGNIPLSPPLLAALIFISLFSLISIIIYLAPAAHNKYRNMLSAALYFVLLTAMTAGVAEIAGRTVCIVSSLLSAAIVIFGFDKMTKFNSFIIIAIIVLLPTVCLRFLGQPTGGYAIEFPALSRGMFSAFVYGGLNCCMLDKIIDASMEKTTKKQLYISALLSSFVISLFAYLILNAIAAAGTQKAAVPLLSVSNNPITFTVILLAILSSQYSALFATVSAATARRAGITTTGATGQKAGVITGGDKTGAATNGGRGATKNRKAVVAAAAFLSFICSFLGFSKLVGIFYPITGVIIFLFLISSMLVSLLFRPKQPNSALQHTSLRQTPPHSRS